LTLRCLEAKICGLSLGTCGRGVGLEGPVLGLEGSGLSLTLALKIFALTTSLM